MDEKYTWAGGRTRTTANQPSKRRRRRRRRRARGEVIVSLGVCRLVSQ